jgi:hypothetical protein
MWAAHKRAVQQAAAWQGNGNVIGMLGCAALATVSINTMDWRHGIAQVSRFDLIFNEKMNTTQV